MMSNPHSMVHHGIEDEQKSIVNAIQQGQWVGAANNTKWTELINAIRERDWKPSYRSCWISNRYISEWDTEWYAHLPYPFSGVLWLDLGTQQRYLEKSSHQQKMIDHSAQLMDLLKQIGFEFEQREDIIRIWGYLPKDETDFPPRTHFKPQQNTFLDTWK